MDVPRKKNTSLSMYIVGTSVSSCIFIITDLQWTYTHMLSKCLFFVCWTPFLGCNMWSFTVGTFWLFFLFIWASFMMMALPTDKAFGFGPTSFGRMSETLAVPTLLYRNWCTKFFHPINNTCFGQVKFL